MSHTELLSVFSYNETHNCHLSNSEEMLWHYCCKSFSHEIINYYACACRKYDVWAAAGTVKCLAWDVLCIADLSNR